MSRLLTEEERWERLTPDQRQQPRTVRLAAAIEGRVSRADERAYATAAQEDRASARRLSDEAMAARRDELATVARRALEELRRLPQESRAKRQRIDRALREMAGV